MWFLPNPNYSTQFEVKFYPYLHGENISSMQIDDTIPQVRNIFSKSKMRNKMIRVPGVIPLINLLRPFNLINSGNGFLDFLPQGKRRLQRSEIKSSSHRNDQMIGFIMPFSRFLGYSCHRGDGVHKGSKMAWELNSHDPVSKRASASDAPPPIALFCPPMTRAVLIG